MRNRVLTLVLVCPLLTAPLLGQTGNEIVSVGYGVPLPTPVAPGQLVTLFVRGLNGGPAMASTLPLPTMLAGVSVSLRQPGLASAFAPILRILPVDAAGLGCGGAGLCDAGLPL